MGAGSRRLLVKGVQLVVDHFQLIRFPHFVLLLHVRLARLHVLAARHRFRREIHREELRDNSASRDRSEIQDARPEAAYAGLRCPRYRTVTVRACVRARSRLPPGADILIAAGPAQTRENRETGLRNFLIGPPPPPLLSLFLRLTSDVCFTREEKLLLRERAPNDRFRKTRWRRF